MGRCGDDRNHDRSGVHWKNPRNSTVGSRPGRLETWISCRLACSQMCAYPLDLSVVIPAWNEGESLKETIERISDALRATEAQGRDWEIIVCDNGSTDDTAEIARRAGARVTLEHERGIARARNAGARVARGEWLLFIDADTYPSPELLSDVRALVGEGGMVGGGSLTRPIGGQWWTRLMIRWNNIRIRLAGDATASGGGEPRGPSDAVPAATW